MINDDYYNISNNFFHVKKRGLRAKVNYKMERDITVSTKTVKGRTKEGSKE